MASIDETNPAEAQRPRPTFLRRARFVTYLIRDVGLILGIPALIAVGVNLYELQIKALEQQASAADAQVKIAEHELEAVKEASSAQLKIATQQFDAVNAQIKATESENKVLKETQFDRALTLIENQKKIYLLNTQNFQKQIDDLKSENTSKKLQFDEINNVFKCEREMLRLVFDKIRPGSANSANAPNPGNGNAPNKTPEEITATVFTKFMDDICVYKEDNPKPLK